MTQPETEIDFDALSEDEASLEIEWGGKRVADMTDLHLSNCIAYLTHKYNAVGRTGWTNVRIAGRSARDWCSIFTAEETRRARIALLTAQANTRRKITGIDPASGPDFTARSPFMKWDDFVKAFKGPHVLTEPDFSAHEQRLFDLFSKQGGNPVATLGERPLPQTDPRSLDYVAPNQFICTDPAGQCDPNPNHPEFCHCTNCRIRREVAFLVRKTALERQKARAEADSARGAVYRPFLTKVSSGGKTVLRVALSLSWGIIAGGLIGLGLFDVAHTFISPRIDTGRSILTAISNWEG